MPSTSDQPDNQPLTSLDRDRQHPHVGKLGQLVEKRRKLLTGVPNQPSFDDRTAIVDHAHPVMCRTPIPSAEHLLTSKSDIAAGAGPTVGSSLFGPRWGSSLAPITRPATTRATNSNRPSSGETSRPSLVVPDEQVNMTRTPILIQ